MNLSASELERRRPVWLALSELFLDTELQANDLQRIARVLHQSRYAERELHRILRDEIGPACRMNLVCPAGEWVGFDLPWLEKEIDRPRLPGTRWMSGWLAMRLVRRHWKPIITMVLKMRNT